MPVASLMRLVRAGGHGRDTAAGSLVWCLVNSQHDLRVFSAFNSILFRWVVGLSMDEVMWDHSTFTKNRERLIGSDIAREFFAKILVQAGDARLLSDEHFSVDGTLLEAWASVPSQGGRGTAGRRRTQYRGGLSG